MFFAFAIVVVLHSYQVWVDPKSFLKRMGFIRSQLYKYSFGIFLPKWVKESMDSNHESEIILARLCFTIIYICILYGLYISITNN